jgi:hypothetical protein
MDIPQMNLMELINIYNYRKRRIIIKKNIFLFAFMKK